MKRKISSLFFQHSRGTLGGSQKNYLGKSILFDSLFTVDEKSKM